MGMLGTSVAFLLHLAACLAAPVPCEEKVVRLEAEIQGLLKVINDQHQYIQELHNSQSQQLEHIPNSHLGPENLYRDCSEVFADGNVASGLYVIRPDGSPTALSVYCDMNNGGGWTVFQRRRDGTENFDRAWVEYKHGFGNQIQNQNNTNLDQAQPSQVRNQIQQGTGQLHSRAEGEEASLALQAHRPSPLKKKAQTALESKRNLGPTARAVASHLNSSCGLRKAQSVHSLLSDTGDPSLSQLTSRPSREIPPQLLLPPQRPTTLPSSPRRPPSSMSLPPQRPSPASPRSPQQETAVTPSAAATPRKSSSSSSTPSAPRSYMSPTASSMAKMSRSVSVGDGLNIEEPAEDPAVTLSSSSAVTTSSQVKETPPPLVAMVPSNTALATPPHATVVPVVAAASSSSGNQAANPSRSLQARVPASSRPLPDKPSLASFTPSSKTAATSSSSTSRPPPVSVSPLTPPQQEEEPQTPAGSGAEQRDDTDQPISVETCRALTNELQSCFKRATHLYRKVSGSSTDDSTPYQRQMAVLLSDAFQAMRAELDSLPLGEPSMLGGEGGLGGVGEVKTAALLEEYSLLLLQAVHRRINTTSS